MNLNPNNGAINIDTASLTGFVSNYNAVTPLFTVDDGAATYNMSAWQLLGHDQQSRAATTEASLFVNAARGDFHLLPGSMAVGSGTATDSPATDLSGNARPGTFGIDIGAYQT